MLIKFILNSYTQIDRLRHFNIQINLIQLIFKKYKSFLLEKSYEK